MSSLRRPDAITTLACDYDSGVTAPPRAHHRDRLIYGVEGVMAVQAAEAVWVIRPSRAVWVPAGTPHSIRMCSGVAMRSLYFRPRLAPSLPQACGFVVVSNLLKELILHVCSRRSVMGVGADDTDLIRFLAGRIEISAAPPVNLAAPTDRRAQRVADEVLAGEAGPQAIKRLCRSAGVSRRSLERLFLRETGLSFGRWTRQARLIRGLEALGRGASVSEAAFEAGYASASAFCVAFRRTLGATPRAYLGPTRTKGP